MRFYSDRDRRAFTIIELLVVIAIIGILSSIIMASLNSARKRGRDGRRLTDIKQIQLSLVLYYDRNRVYPPNLDALKTGSYIPSVPVDPVTGADYQYVPLQGAGLTGSDCQSYHLGTLLEMYTESTFDSDTDAIPGGTYNNPSNPKEDGPVCAGGGSDFSGADDSSDPAKFKYDVRP